MNMIRRSALITIALLGIVSSKESLAQEKNEQNFLEAALEGDFEAVLAAVVSGIDINARAPLYNGSGGETALHLATDTAILLFLLAQDCINPNIGDAWQRTPLIWATINAPQGNTIMENKVLLLLNEAPHLNVNAQDDRGNSALHYAARYGAPKIIEALLAKGADRSLRNNINEMPISLAITSGNRERIALLAKPLFDAVAQNNQALIRQFATAHNLLQVRDLDGNNLLHWAMVYGTDDMVGLLLTINPALMGQVNNKKETPLELGVTRGDLLRKIALTGMVN